MKVELNDPVQKSFGKLPPRIRSFVQASLLLLSLLLRTLVIGSSFLPLYRIALGRLPLCPFFFFILSDECDF